MNFLQTSSNFSHYAHQNHIRRSNRSEISFIITGSARLDYYSKGGDSLHGRYHYYRLHPFSPRELNPIPTKDDIQVLLKFGGFPEPCLRGKKKFWRRWQRERLQRVIYEDIRDLENIKEISLLELLANELPGRISSPLSVKNLKELLDVAHETVERWLKIFERMYYCFRISPYGPPKIRAVKKERKLYLWDWSIVPDHGARFENFIASQLLKYCHFIEDTEGLKVDSEGNVYVTGKGGIWVLTPEGQRLGIIKVPELPANLCWGDRNWKTLYITAMTSVYRICLNVAGIAVS